MILARLLRVERLSAGAFHERAGAALQPFFDAVLALKPGIKRGEFQDCIRLALPSALDVSLAEVVAGGWRSHGQSPAGMRIRSTHRSIVDVRAGERLLCCIEVRAEVTLELAPLRVEANGAILVTDRGADAGAELYCAGALVLEEAIRPVAVPQRIALLPL